MAIEGRSDVALAGGANLAAIGDELVQFGRAERVAPSRYRLSRLLRGRRGTEWAAVGHAAGEPFCLIAPESVLAVPVPAGAIGSEARLVAVGVGDSLEGAAAIRQVSGEAVRPPSPVHLRARRESNGDVQVSWARRSRLGWTWASGSEAPLGEEREVYHVTMASAAGSRSFETGEPRLSYPAAQQAADGISGPLTIAVVQIGTHCASREALVSLG
jgi:hypothetical protein